MVTAEPQQQQQHFVDGETGNGMERNEAKSVDSFTTPFPENCPRGTRLCLISKWKYVSTAYV